MDIIQIYEKFPSQADCITYLEQIRWGDSPKCPYCKSDNSTPLNKEMRHHCNNCNTSYSVTVGTIFHRTHLPLQKWFLAVCLILNAKKGISSRQLSRDLKVNKDTAWRISMKIREAMSQREQRELLTGMVEMDETYIGGKPRKGNKNEPGGGNKRGRGTKKTPVVGLAQRDGKVKAEVMKNRSLKAKDLFMLVRKNVNIDKATIITDEFTGYIKFGKFVDHKTVDHQSWYVHGDAHTNTIESFWAILKRGIVGQYHKVSVNYLPMYIDKFCYRFNNRKHKNLFAHTIQKGSGGLNE